MRTFMVAGALVLLTVSVVSATTGDVVFTPRGANTNPLNAIDPSVDPWLIITASTQVTGDNQGLAGYMLRLGVRDLSLPMGDVFHQNWALHSIPQENLSWAMVYDAQPQDGIGVGVTVTGTGPGMCYGTGLGTPSSSLAFVDQIGAGYLDWDPRRYENTKAGPAWVGDNTWGVGLDSRKSALLVDPNGSYDLNVIAVDLTGWHAGNYQVEILDGADAWGPRINGSVLNAGLDLNMPSPGGILTSLDLSHLHGESFDFTIVPEPATFLVLGIPLFVLRRRWRA